MNIEVVETGPNQIPVLRRLMQLYLYDLFFFGGGDIEDDGTYGNAEWLDDLSTNERRQRYFIKVDRKLAGFAITRRGTYFSGDEAKEISEFFVLRKYRRRGGGKSVAGRLFNGFGGTWEAAVLDTNTPAQHFWRAAIADYTGGRYEEFCAHYRECDFVVFRFSGGHKRPNHSLQTDC
jgi:predicted acetyltransferase